MGNINSIVHLLVAQALAGFETTPADERADGDLPVVFAGLDTPIQEALAEQQAEQQKAVAKVLAGQLVGIQQRVADHRRTRRERMAQLRRERDAVKGQLADLDRCLAYSQHVSPLPMLHLLGLAVQPPGVSYDDWQKVIRVPKDWTPPTAEG